MPTRISTGTMVQATSMRVLWVVLDGIGLALALNLTMTTINSARTNSVIRVISQNRKLWNQMMFSITGEAAAWRVYSHGAGWPISANAAPPPASTAPTTANPSNRRPVRPIDIVMPLALLVTKTLQHAIFDGTCCPIRASDGGRQHSRTGSPKHLEIQPLKP